VILSHQKIEDNKVLAAVNTCLNVQNIFFKMGVLKLHLLRGDSELTRGRGHNLITNQTWDGVKGGGRRWTIIFAHKEF